MIPTWKRRRARVETLGATHTPATELLGFYAKLLEQQEAIMHRADRWAGRRHTGGPVLTAGPLVAVERLVGSVQHDIFRRFVRDIGKVATPVLAAVAGRLGESTTARSDALERFVGRESLDGVAKSLDCDTLPLAFFPHAFMQPIAEAAVARVRGVGTLAPPTGVGDEASAVRVPARCPWCGWPAQVAMLRDEGEVRGRRLLGCSLCAGEWTVPRAMCPGCGEQAADKLLHHVSESWPHVRVEECRSCGRYLKSVDMRTDGFAVPTVDELASVELDLWAAEQGLQKLQRNLLGL